MKSYKEKNLIIILRNKLKNPKEVLKILAIIFLIIAVIIGMVFLSKEEKKQKYIEYNGKNINEIRYPGYKELIDKLQKEHPNWTFTLFYTKLSWEDVIKNEGHKDNVKYPTNLIPDSTEYPEDWRCEIDQNKKFDNGTWLCASNKAIKNQMDPRNILNDDNIFEFVELKYVDGAQTLKGIEKITQNTFLDNENVEKSLIEAGKKANIDPYFLASRLIQEQGKKGTTLSKGYQYDENTIVYNPFNIKASGNSQSEIIEKAAKYAYEQDWDTLEKGLLGGVEFVKEGYINKGQNTLYLQKFDVVKQDGKLYTNQYMQNLLAATSEASNMRKIYDNSNSTDTNLNFIIPLYEKMPEKAEER